MLRIIAWQDAICIYLTLEAIICIFGAGNITWDNSPVKRLSLSEKKPEGSLSRVERNLRDVV